LDLLLTDRSEFAVKQRGHLITKVCEIALKAVTDLG
jgi:hypothetical protein